MSTKAETTITDIAAFLKARCTLLWVVTNEEVRAERGIIEAAGRAKFLTQFWDCATGLSDAQGKTLDEELANPTSMLRRIGEKPDKLVYVMRDLHRFMDPIVVRTLRSLARALQLQPLNEARAIVVLSPSAEVPPELAGSAIVIDYPLPDRAEMAQILDAVLQGMNDDEKAAKAAPNGTRDAAIDAAVGLSAEEAANCYARSLVTCGRIDPKMISAEKKRVIDREKVLTWVYTDPRGLDAVGGLELLKAWLIQRRLAFSQKARAYGLPAPKGVLLVGQPGCGKSLVAKTVATAYGMPLLRLDMGGLRSKFVGESEANLRKALAQAEAVAPCVLWVDELDKSVESGPQGDGGVSNDAKGTLLSWMQEHTAPVFVVATANDVAALPPELLRKGRFDELFFVDLPNDKERTAIVETALQQHGRKLQELDGWAIWMERLVQATASWSGAEIASLVPTALFAAFAEDGRALTMDDLIAATANVVPLSKTAEEIITARRKWAQGRARPASIAMTETTRTGRALDL